MHDRHPDPRDEDFDLGEATDFLRAHFAGQALWGYLHGKEALRNAAMERYEISALQAEELIDTLEARRFIYFDGDPQRESSRFALWRFESRAQPRLPFDRSPA